VSYQNYVIAAYTVFAVVLLWDFVAPRIQIRQQLRAAKLRIARDAARTTPTEL
jgi:heme exporter protein D